MQIKELLLGLPVLGFVIWVFMAPFPQDRIARGCQPIHWIGNVATSTTALSSAENTKTTARWSDKLNYSCQYMVWRLFYQDEYNKAVAAGLITPVSTTPAPAPTPTPATQARPTQPAPAAKNPPPAADATPEAPRE